MARTANVPCTGTCGKLLYRGTGSLPAGQVKCRQCRAAERGLEAGHRARALCAGGCGKMLAGGRKGSLPPGERTCRACRAQTREAKPVVACSELGCGRPADARGLCKTHWGKAYGNVERRKARQRAKTHLRKAATRQTDITPEYEIGLRAKAKCCPLCAVKMTDAPYLPHSKELDHIVPLNVGGTHTMGNVRIICRKCNGARPHDGSDYSGPVTLWAQVEVA